MLFEVITVTGQRWEVEQADERSLGQAIDRGIILPARSLRASGDYEWRINGAHIVAYQVIEAD